jgi:hypothetical protein
MLVDVRQMTIARASPTSLLCLTQQEGNMAKIVHANELPHSVMVFLKAKRGPRNKAMPTGPKGERRPADVIGNAVHVMRIATGGVDRTEQARHKLHH